MHQVVACGDVVDETDDLAGRPYLQQLSVRFHPQSVVSIRNAYTMLLVAILEHLASTFTRDVWRNLLELARRALTLDLDRVGRDLVLEQPTGVFPPAQNELRVRLLRINNSLLDVLVDRGFDRAHETGTHVNALSSQGQRSGQTLPVRETSRSDERHSHSLASARQQDEVGNVALTDVAGAFEAINREEVDAEFDGAQGVADRGALVQDDTGRVGFFQLLDDGAWAVAGGFHDADSLFQEDAGVGGVVWGHHGGEEGEVYSEGVRGHGFAAADLFAKVFGCGLGQGRDETQTAGVGDGGGELGVAHPHHAALDDGDWGVLVRAFCGRGWCCGYL
jgi:hypothetical protein